MDIQQLDSLFCDLLARNRAPGYGVAVTHAAPDVSSVDVTVKFLAGRTYCCYEPFCHVPYDAAKVIRFAAERGVALPQSLQINWHFTTEAGAISNFRKPLNTPHIAKHQEYDEVSVVKPAR